MSYVAELIENNNGYICSNCRMPQHSIEAECQFCYAQFTNYETIMYKIFKIKEKNNNEV